MVRSLRQWPIAVALLAIACGKSETPPEPASSAPASAASPSSTTAVPALPEAAGRQIQALLAEKEARTAAQQKIESRLLYEIKMRRGEPIAAGIERLDSNVKVDQSGAVRVELQTRGAAQAALAVQVAGGTVLTAFEQWNSVTARVPIASIERVAEDPAVLWVSELLDPQTNADPEAPPGPIGGAGTDLVNTSQGDVTHEANAARATYGARGQGVKIGVLSDSADNLSVSQANGDLGPVTVLPGQSGIPGTGEGTAMLEIVHDLAPDAELFFATAFGGTAVFASNILALRDAGCSVIVDDIFYFNESPFQDAIVAQAVNTFVAGGGIYVSSAGNAGSIAKGRAGVYEGNFVDSGTTLPGTGPGPGAVNRFDNGSTNDNNDQMTVGNGGNAPVTLFWSDALLASSNDYDLFVFNAGLGMVTGASTNPQNGTQNPFEQTLNSPAANSRLVVVKRTMAAPRFLHLNTNRGRLAIPTIGQTKGHSAALGAFSVAATPAGAPFGGGSPTGPFPMPFSPSNLVELFSSDGPRKMFYNANGTLANGSNSSLLADGGIVRQKPDITGADGVSTSVTGFDPFFGTSAAAPHVAAIAALMKSAVPGATTAQIRTALTSSAFDIETAGTDITSGAGIATAPAALAALGAMPVPLLALGVQTVSAPGGNGNGVWEPGESATLLVTLSNVGVASATSITATLSTSAPNVTITQGSSPYPNIASGAGAQNSTAFGLTLANAAFCASIPVRLVASYSGRQGTFDFVVPVGVAGTPQTISYVNPAVAIPDASTAGVNVPLAVGGLTGGISDIDFRFDGSMSSTAVGATTVGLDHSFVGDLVLTLRSPAGTDVVLTNRMGLSLNGGNNFFQTRFDDSGTTSIQGVAEGANPFAGTFKPDQALSAFNNQNPNGTWQLRAQDLSGIDTGSVRKFSLVITPRSCTSLPGLGTPCSNDAQCASGHCTDGVCCNDACGDDAPGDCQACSAAGICGAAPAASVCRTSAGACDAAETCSGQTTCPADAAVMPGTACGAAPSGDCDVQDTCSGTVGATAVCSPNVRPATFVCRVSAGGCDPAETCTGSSPTCPGDVLASNGTVCRSSVGACDVAEACNGASPTCGPDAAAMPGTACGGAPNGDCDAQDTCTGTVGATAVCTANFKASSVLCRGSAGTCDVTENCTGSSATCPADGFVSSSTVCRPSAGTCDVAESCTGSGAACPADAAVTPGTACGGPPNGDCDAQDTCAGTVGATATCAANLKPSSAVCRPSAGGCDVAENCTGSATTCPGDVLVSGGTVCRPSVGACDVSEACSGSSAACPADAAVTPGTACGGPPNGDCDLQDSCAGTVGATASCTANFRPPSTVCRASGGACDLAENCTGGAPTCPADARVSSGTVCRSSVGACDLAEACDGSSPTCGPDAAATPGTACGGLPNGACDLQDTCAGTLGATATCAANFRPSSTVCRVSVGACDVSEACSGSSAACPADAAVTPGTACGGPPNGDCDLQDTCAGTVGATASCTANFRPPSTVCRASGGVCDLAENCTGGAPTCPADARVSSGTVCRPSVGGCDLAEACDGSSPTCGPDAAATPGTACGGLPNGDCDLQDTCAGALGATATCAANFRPASTVCRVSGGACDVSENCTGSSVTCPANLFVPRGTECRASGGVCDVAEQCTGSAAACPNDGFVSASTVCRPSAGDCDPIERCTGSAAGCPADVLANSGTLCRPAAGECDLEERCTGSTPACAADQARPSGTPCGGLPNGDCDAQDECSGGVGASATCLARFQPSSVVCRGAAGDCDLAERCSGSAPVCPPDAFAGDTSECRPATGVCDLAERCTGGAATCPADGFAPSTTSCTDASACTTGDLCSGSGACQSGTPVDCNDNNPCTAERCDAATGCVAEPVTDGTSCDDGNACTQRDACAAGTCRGTGIDCNDANPCTNDSCSASGGCVHTPITPGAACDDGDRCTVMDACSAQGTCAPGTPLDCDDDNECTLDACESSSGCVHPAARNGTRCAGGDGVCRNGSCDTGAGGQAGEGTGGGSGRGGSAGRGGTAGASTGGSGATGGEGGEAGASVGGSSGSGGVGGRGGSAGSAGLGEGGDNGAGEGGEAGTPRKKHPHVTETSGCGCRVPDSGAPSAGMLAWLVVPLALAFRRRRYARNPRRNNTSS